MDVVCLGLSHKTAPVELREKFAVGDLHLGEIALELARAGGVDEAVIVSTCNRVEYYVVADDGARGAKVVADFIAGRAGIPPEAFYQHRGDEGARHLFRVVSGLESMVIGETEILGQVKKAYQAAQTAGATSRHLNKLFQRAFNVAKEVRTQTSITRGAVSVGSAAVDLAEKIHGKLDHCNVMILGAGETAEMTAKALQLRGAKAVFVSNRTYERAAALAESLGGKAIHFDAWEGEFETIDILIGSTGAPHAVVTAQKLAPLMKHRADRPLFCIDLAVPRDFEATVNDLDGVYLYDIDALQSIADQSMQVRRKELVRCEQMIERHVGEYREWLLAPRPVLPLHPQAEGGEMMQLVLGTRGSALALAQVDLTEAALAKAWPSLLTRRQTFITRGDQKLDLNLLQKGDGGGKGLFTRELENALLDGEIDVAVHSMKDLPGHNPPGLEISAVLERAPIADILVSKAEGGFAALPKGATVGTSSIRRARQIAWHRPDLRIEEWRGNVPTRLRKLGERPEVAAIVLAEAGLRRLNYKIEQGSFECEGGNFFASSLADYLVPAIGQGAVALQIRRDRLEVAEILSRINHAPTMLAIRAEREVQRLLAGDCSVPVGVRTELAGSRITLRGILFGPDSGEPLTAEAEGIDPERVARELCAQLKPGVELSA